MRLSSTITWFLSATVVCHEPQLPMGAMTMTEPDWRGRLSETHADRLARTLMEFQQRQWGFVIVRTTYTSDAKWAEFLSILDDSIRFWFSHPSYQMHSHLYEKHVMTVLEDAARLSDANMALTARVFEDWVQSAEAQAECKDTPFDNAAKNKISPRYHQYIHADEASVQQVLYQHATRKPVPKDQHWIRSAYLYEDRDLITVKVVHSFQVQAYQEGIAQEYGIYANTDVIEEELEEDELMELVKRVRIYEIPDLYSILADSLDMWFNVPVDDGVFDG